VETKYARRDAKAKAGSVQRVYLQVPCFVSSTRSFCLALSSVAAIQTHQEYAAPGHFVRIVSGYRQKAKAGSVQRVYLQVRYWCTFFVCRT
jgi:hypothetical protein